MKKYFREGINLSLENLKNNGVISKLLRKWLMRNDQQDCLLQKDEVNNNFNLFYHFCRFLVSQPIPTYRTCKL